MGVGLNSALVALLGVIIFHLLQNWYQYSEDQEPEGSSKMFKKEVEALFSEFWQWRLQESPEFASIIGNHIFDDKLESYSLEAFQKRKSEAESFLEVAKDLLSEVKDEVDHSNLELFIADLQSFIDGINAFGYFYPINHLEGVHIELERIVKSCMNLESVDDFWKLIARYRAFPKQAEEIIELLREGIRQGRTNHLVSMENVPKQFADLQTSVEESPFFQPFLSIPKVISSSEKEALKSEAHMVIKSQLLPAFQALGSFIESEYMAALRPNISVSSLPDGEKFYQECLKFHISCDMSPEEVHKIGLQEVERISKDLDEVVETLASNVTTSEFLRKIRTDPQFFYKTSEELLSGYEDIVLNQIRPKLPLIIKNIPKMKLSIIPTPPTMSGGPLAYYLSGAEDGSRPGTFFVNTGDIAASPKYEMMSLSLHEAEPGHHLQSSYMIEQTGVPAFRRNIEDRKYSDVPSRFPLHTAYLEGWGLYSEFLGHELGLYEDPYFLLGRLSQEIFRACRLVVDTGIHAFGWSREKAINFMLEHSAATKQNIEKEVDRYITWPGQACAYKIGELKIKELRNKAKTQLGKIKLFCLI
ncbi:uncharacterized protein LOC106458959 [Limulus polyphemus]|uniref:Uncharacterized protein LOC106458959 n=1 Tax=Limulus polyphemus TaxID=6850 RepID=A0ABM1B3D8_LIMPO|nr:uncharacterized protein LOC106458959 [Limulus polyphemus]